MGGVLIKYIFPNIIKIKSKDILNKNDYENSILYDEHYNENTITKIKNILDLNRVCVISEPGYGKTKLAREVFNFANEKNKKAFILDLKKLEGDIEVSFNKKIENAKIFDVEFNEYDYNMAKTENFQLVNDENTIIILDSLDEVEKYKFNKVVDFILDFSNTQKYKKVKIIVTCRNIHMINSVENFNSQDFQFIRIEKFSDSQVEGFLKEINFQEKDIKKLKKELNIEGGACIRVPRYLILLGELKEKGLIDFNDLSKSNMFEKFIDYKLNKENNVTHSNDKEIVKRLLEQFALVMEIYQKNQITMDELMSFLIDVKSDLKYYFLNNCKLEEIYTRSILRKTQNGNKDIIEFENTEFQEYMAAKEISRMDNYEQVIFDLAVNKNLNEIYTNWYNPLKFLIEKNNRLLRYIIEFGKKNNDIITNNYFQFLVNIDATKISNKDKFLIFKIIFEYYQKQNIWIDSSIVSEISDFFTKDGEGELKKYVNENNPYQLGNVVIIINQILKNKGMDCIDKQYWEDKLIKLVENENEVVQRVCIGALGWFNSINKLKSIFEKIKKEDKLIYESLIWSCIRIDPNDRFSINIFIEGVKKEYFYAIDGINKINELLSLKYLLNQFKDEELLENFLKRQDFFYVHKSSLNEGIIHNIEKNIYELKTEIEELLFISIERDYNNYIYNSKFIKNLVNIICEYKIVDLDYVLEIVSNNKKNIYNEILLTLSVYLLNEKNVRSFAIKASEKDLNNFLLNVFKYSKDFNNNIYECGREYFKKEYEEFEKYYIENKKKEIIRDKEIYKKFIYMINYEKPLNTNVYNYILNNKEKLIPFINENGNYKDKLIVFIYEVFDTFKVENQSIRITERKDDGSISISSTWELYYFNLCLELSKILEIDISNIRKKILLALPFLDLNNDTEEMVNKVIKNPIKDEIDSIIDFYSLERIDDLKEVNAGNIINLIKKYDLKELNTILERYLNNTNINIWYRIDSIDILGKDEKYKDLIEKIFETYKNKNSDNEEYKLAMEANKVLIEKYKSDDAIQWRIIKIKEDADIIPERNKVGVLSPKEAELTSKIIASPIMNLSDEKYVPIMLDLLEYSFELLIKDNGYFEYTNYIWDIVCSFYENLKGNGTSKYMLELEKWYLKKNYKCKDSNWFSHKIERLKHIYLESVDKPSNIKKCIRIYNQIIEKNYLEISNEEDILNTLLDIIDNDLRKWVEIEGAYRFIEESSGKQEAMIQKTIVTQFENFLLKKGFRQTEIIREPQNYDDKRPDLVISYGFFGRVVIEIKRGCNEQVTNKNVREKYLGKLKEYMVSNTSNHLIYLIFDTNDNKNFHNNLIKVRNEYSGNPQIYVKGLKCIKYND